MSNIILFFKHLWLNFKITFFYLFIRFRENIADADVWTPIALNMSVNKYSTPTQFRPISRYLKYLKLVLYSFLKYKNFKLLISVKILTLQQQFWICPLMILVHWQNLYQLLGIGNVKYYVFILKIYAKMHGFVNKGMHIETEHDNTVPVKNILVFLVVGLNVHWKMPIGHFLVARLKWIGI